MKALACLALAGCNWAFGLHEVKPDVDADPCGLHAGDPGFHDEDGDGHDNSCDNCPGIANPDQSDALELANGQMPDGIGDACDPSPGVTGDRIARFISFDEPGVMAELAPLTGSWRVSGGALQADATGTFDLIIATLVDLPPAMPYAVETHVQIDTFSQTAGVVHEVALYASLVANAGSPETGSATCGIHENTVPAVTTYADLKNMRTDQSSLGNSKFGVGAGYVFRATARATQLACRFDGDGGDAGANAQTGALAVGKVGFGIQDLSAHFDYVVFYDLSGEP